jgi:hypothetical protein
VEDKEDLMHAKYKHELCSLLMHITTYYNILPRETSEEEEVNETRPRGKMS